MHTEMKRRAFIKAAAAGIGGLSVWGARGQDAAGGEKPLRVAVIGCGGHGTHVHIPAACKERLVALGDPDKRQLAGAVKRVREVSPPTQAPAIRTCADYRKQLDDMGKAQDFASAQTGFERDFTHLRAYGPHAFGWTMADLSPQGATGNAAAASSEAGEKILDHAAQGFAELLQDIALFDIAKLT